MTPWFYPFFVNFSGRENIRRQFPPCLSPLSATLHVNTDICEKKSLEFSHVMLEFTDPFGRSLEFRSHLLPWHTWAVLNLFCIQSEDFLYSELHGLNKMTEAI